MGKEDYLNEFEQLVLLAVLRLRDNAYGMTIRREIEERGARHVSIAAVYTTLDRLEEKGFVSSRRGDPVAVRGGRARRTFKVLGAGASALHESRTSLARMWRGIVLEGAGS